MAPKVPYIPPGYSNAMRTGLMNHRCTHLHMTVMFFAVFRSPPTHSCGKKVKDSSVLTKSCTERGSLLHLTCHPWSPERNKCKPKITLPFALEML